MTFQLNSAKAPAASLCSALCTPQSAFCFRRNAHMMEDTEGNWSSRELPFETFSRVHYFQYLRKGIFEKSSIVSPKYRVKITASTLFWMSITGIKTSREPGFIYALAALSPFKRPNLFSFSKSYRLLSARTKKMRLCLIRPDYTHCNQLVSYFIFLLVQISLY